MIGNKCDLENDRVISKEQGQAAANEWGGGRMKHYETSAKSNINVTEVIILIHAIAKTWIRKMIDIKLLMCKSRYSISSSFRCLKKS